ncbi:MULTISPECIES: glycine cleavage system protein GcvH [unclassified Synechococcus]|uniref:glycine cleavage system protein GcvH n=1 Tax=unclassified Synechococcus TaxID=2626047 RepID=UPI001CF7F4F7|nr:MULTISPECIES: glycine cleavage system protein GcvH [unclassified Synechococcus]MCB4376716.1 glycine cleavage system protein GcvH [Synechococcus sp. MU1650]MCB4411278.1 glycine cleavage system protein GcvH [Synechococcus sp. MU1611]
MAFAFPDSFRFADSHEYANADGELVRVGISAFAVDQLGDIVFVDLPDVGSNLAKGTSFGSVESVKAVEDMYAPIAGEVVQRNEAVLASPEELQNDPHGEGWLLVLRPADPSELESLMTAEAYSAKVNAG